MEAARRIAAGTKALRVERMAVDPQCNLVRLGSGDVYLHPAGPVCFLCPVCNVLNIQPAIRCDGAAASPTFVLRHTGQPVETTCSCPRCRVGFFVRDGRVTLVEDGGP